MSNQTRYVPHPLLRPGLIRIIAGLGLACIALPGIAPAQPQRTNARVVHVREARIYLAGPDSLHLPPGTTLTFMQKSKPIAAGEVTAVLDPNMVAATLTSGSLTRVKKLERLRVFAERPLLRPAPILRVGYPAKTRSNLLFECDKMTFHGPDPQGAYWTDLITERSYRFVRDTTVAAPRPWPDTLLVRLFDDAADEEIALERGELDAAVFWPGEASPHIREFAKWRGHPSGMRSLGFIEATATDPDGRPEPIAFAASERRSIASLDQELFRGDLVPCVGATAVPSRADSAGDWAMPGLTRFEVDSACPGRQLLEQFLNREGRSVPGGLRPVRISYVDAPGHEPSDTSATRCLFAVGCPVMTAPALLPYVEALGPGALANLFECGPSRRKP